MAEPQHPNEPSDVEPAEGSRERETVNLDIDDQAFEERYDESEGDEGGGISNRPQAEEIQQQRDVPARRGATGGGPAS
jgi:hypothetical protein